MTPTEIKKILAEVGGDANKRLGQHFLVDPKTLEEIVEHAHLHPGSVVLEIGPGLGVLTRALLDAGAEVVAIERDRRFVEYLGNVPIKIIPGDAADLDWNKIVGDREWSLIANLPYSITSLALRKALWSPRPPENVVVLVQREVAERAIARDGKTSLLSLMVALSSSSARIVRRVSRGAFFPPPNVESAVLQITPMPLPERIERWGIEPEKIMEIAKLGFAHPRKLLASNLKSLITIEGWGGTQESPLGKCGILETARAEELSPDDWAKLSQEIIFGSKRNAPEASAKPARGGKRARR